MTGVDQFQLGAVELREHGGDEVLRPARADHFGVEGGHDLLRVGQVAGDDPEGGQHPAGEADGIEPLAAGVADGDSHPPTGLCHLVEVPSDAGLRGDAVVAHGQAQIAHSGGDHPEDGPLGHVGDPSNVAQPGLAPLPVPAGRDRDGAAGRDHRQPDHLGDEAVVANPAVVAERNGLQRGAGVRGGHPRPGQGRGEQRTDHQAGDDHISLVAGEVHGDHGEQNDQGDERTHPARLGRGP